MYLQIGDFDINCYENIEENLKVTLKKLSKDDFVNRFTADRGIKPEGTKEV
jgi:hypothetical protein